MEPFLSVYGHVTTDQIISVGHFPEINESVDIVAKKTTLGGTGSNIAMVAAKLGVPTAICAFVGDDFRSDYEKEMVDSGLMMDDFVHVGEYETSTALVLNDSSLKQKVVFFQGPQGNASKLGIDLTNMASRSRYVHFCTGEPEYYISLLGKIGGADKAIDPAQEIYKMWDGDKLKRAMAKSHSFFCNDFEAKVAEKYLGISDIFDCGMPLVVRTMGSDGSRAMIGTEALEVPCVKADAVVDATGAGDAFRAGLYAGMFYGYDIRDSLILAASVSSFIVEKVGALTNVPEWDDVLVRARPYL